MIAGDAGRRIKGDKMFYKIFAEDVTDQSRRYIGKAFADKGGQGLYALYADECDDQEEIVIVGIE